MHTAGPAGGERLAEITGAAGDIQDPVVGAEDGGLRRPASPGLITAE